MVKDAYSLETTRPAKRAEKPVTRVLSLFWFTPLQTEIGLDSRASPVAMDQKIASKKPETQDVLELSSEPIMV